MKRICIAALVLIIAGLCLAASPHQFRNWHLIVDRTSVATEEIVFSYWLDPYMTNWAFAYFQGENDNAHLIDGSSFLRDGSNSGQVTHFNLGTNTHGSATYGIRVGAAGDSSVLVNAINGSSALNFMHGVTELTVVAWYKLNVSSIDRVVISYNDIALSNTWAMIDNNAALNTPYVYFRGPEGGALGGVSVGDWRMLSFRWPNVEGNFSTLAFLTNNFLVTNMISVPQYAQIQTNYITIGDDAARSGLNGLIGPVFCYTNIFIPNSHIGNLFRYSHPTNDRVLPMYTGVNSNYTENGTNFTANSFTRGGYYYLATNTLCDILIAAGGGAGGDYWYGGGAAGGVIVTSMVVVAGYHKIGVGRGGTVNVNGILPGSDSFFDTLVAYGGGQFSLYGTDGTGGSGGGRGGVAGGPGASGVAGQGHNGGSCTDSGTYPTGGGGGAGQNGRDGVAGQSGHGGWGVSNSFSGVMTVYGDGGGGCGHFFGSAGGTGGSGGGGNGGIWNTVNATAATGYGGGGGSGLLGGAGKQGIVVIRRMLF